MKNIIKFIGTALACAAFLVACDKNEPAVFDDANAFVAFEKTAVAIPEGKVDEEGKILPGTSVKIPVTLASVAGLTESIKFEVSYPEKKAAKQGTNFELLTTSGVLSFDAQNRTRYIEIEPKYDGVYTGDLSFTITLVGTTAVATGNEAACEVTINDLDHPLSAILGSYTASGEHLKKGATSWTMTILKDADDDHKVWFDDIFGNPDWAGNDMLYYGNVNADLTEIVVPFGQKAEYEYEGHPVYLQGIDGKGDDADIVKSGALKISISTGADGKVHLEFQQYGLYLYIDTLGWASAIWPGITAVKD